MTNYNNNNNNYQGGGYQPQGEAGSYYNSGRNDGPGGPPQYGGQQPQYGQPQGGYGGHQGGPPDYSSGGNQNRPPPYGGQGGQDNRPDYQPHPSQNEGWGNEKRDDRRDDRQNNYGGSGPNEDGPDGERGVLGALAGGAAGAFGGHKLGGKATGHSKTSAVVGALAGAFAGHKLQDGVSDWKDDRDEKKEEEKRRKEEEKRREEEEKRRRDERRDERRDDDHHGHHGGRRHSRSRSRSRSRDRGHHHGGGGNFSASSEDVYLEHGRILKARCRADGSLRDSSLNLDDVLENDNGRFRWVSGGGGHDHGHGGGSWTVRPGDTLRSIASNYSVSWEEIARHNGLSNPDLIHPGQTIQIPGGGGHHSRGGNFSGSARDARLRDHGRRLEAELRRDNGDWERAEINLDERIGNINGSLRLV
ncbi:unnamed protein product [Clonostachys rhizophaga]|uniref:LysM domain-containing protein n=1 Tax=Clonostachys rhizophaga TaxID=160324 RepID=A0A9N9VNQ9_9HYPO|nr:unnamed protein product [Clonostachys rhizophaga]